MRNKILLAVGMMAIAGAPTCRAQSGGSTPPGTVRSGPNLPSKCRPGPLATFFKTTATIGLYFCSAPDTWTIVSQTPGTGITDVNSDSSSSQAFTSGTSGTDFAITNPGGGSHVFNLPFATAAHHGKLSSTDWSNFNGKVGSVVNDTNVTGSISGGALTLGWTGVLGKARIIGTAVYNDQANTYASGLQDLSSANLKLPIAAGFTATSSNMIGYDSTAKNLHGWSNAADAILAMVTGSPANGDCAKFIVSGSTVTVTTAGAACGGGGGGSGDAAQRSTVTPSATPTFAVTSNSSAYLKLTPSADVTSSTLTVASGHPNVTLSICQGATPHTLVWPTTVLNAPTIDSRANYCTDVSGNYDGTNLGITDASIHKDDWSAIPGEMRIAQASGSNSTTLAPAAGGANRTVFIPGSANSAVPLGYSCGAGNHAVSFDVTTGVTTCSADSGGGGGGFADYQPTTSSITLPLSVETTIFTTTVPSGTLTAHHCIVGSVAFQQTVRTNQAGFYMWVGSVQKHITDTIDTGQYQMSFEVCAYTDTAHEQWNVPVVTYRSGTGDIPAVTSGSYGIWAALTEDLTSDLVIKLTGYQDTGGGDTVVGLSWRLALQ